MKPAFIVMCCAAFTVVLVSIGGLKAVLALGIVCVASALFFAAVWHVIKSEHDAWRYCSLCRRWHNGSAIQKEIPPDHDGVADVKTYGWCAECKEDAAI